MKRHPTSRKRRRAKTTLRRSFALPASLIEQVMEATPAGGPGNLNAIVRSALTEYVARRKEEAFDRAMEEMAADPDTQRVNAEIERDFAPALNDGLANCPWTGGRPDDPAARAPRVKPR